MTQTKRRLALALVLLFALNVVVIFALSEANAQTYRQGSSGDMVKKIQQALKSGGYDPGVVDGIFGSKTVAAVKKFQAAKKLTVDGIVGPQTLKALGLASSGSSSAQTTSGDMQLLARIIAAEARGEPYNGQVAVGAVIMNRMRHPSFPSTLSGVIYQPGAFTAISDGQFASTPVPDSCVRAAGAAMNGSDPTGGCIYYFNPVTATSKWIWSRPQVTTIGKHIFCK